MKTALFPKEHTFWLKGILAMMIVCSHLSYATDILAFSLLNKVGTTVVALFLFISGYGLMYSFMSSGTHFLSKMPQRIWNIFLPMLVATLVYFLWCYLDGKAIETSILNSLLYEGKTPLPNAWFIFVLLYNYILFGLLFRYSSSRSYAILGIGVGNLLFVLWAIAHTYERAWWACAFSLLTGMLYAYRGEIWFTMLRRKWITFCLCAIVMLCYAFRAHCEYLIIIAHCILPLLIVVWLRFFVLPTGKVLNFLSIYSYEIYLVHGIFISLLRGNTLFIASDYLYSILVISCSCIAAYLLQVSLKRLKI